MNLGSQIKCDLRIDKNFSINNISIENITNCYIHLLINRIIILVSSINQIKDKSNLYEKSNFCSNSFIH